MQIRTFFSATHRDSIICEVLNNSSIKIRPVRQTEGNGDRVAMHNEQPIFHNIEPINSPTLYVLGDQWLKCRNG